MTRPPTETDLYDMADQLEETRARCRWQVRYAPGLGVWLVRNEHGLVVSQVTTWAGAVEVARRGCDRRRSRLARAAMTVRGWDL